MIINDCYFFLLRAADYVKSKGVRLVMRNNFMLILFHIFAEVLYEANIIEQEQWEAGEYQLASLNFGSLDSHAAFEVLITSSSVINMLSNISRMSSSMILILVTRGLIFSSQSMMGVITAFG